jgi:hypothetical protein
MKKVEFSKQLLTGLMLVELISILSCSKDPEFPPASGKAVKLVEYISGGDYVKLAYNGEGDVSKITLSQDEYSSAGEVTYQVSYLPGKKINELNGNNGVRIKLTYAGNSLVKSEAYVGNERAYETVYEYVDNNLRSTIIKLVEDNGVRPVLKLFTFCDNAGNPTTIDTYLIDQVTGEIRHNGFVIKKYDNKINPFAGNKDLMQVLLKPVSANNVVGEDYFDTDINLRHSAETEYTYNQEQMPVQARIKKTSTGKDPVVEIAQYSYK